MKICTTIGDGTCLIHAFLLSVSEQYRKSNAANRIRIGQDFRTVQFVQHAANRVETLVIRNVATWLEERHIQLLATTYKQNILVFGYDPKNTPSVYTNTYVGNPGGDYIVMFNSRRTHYEAIQYETGFTIPAAIADAIHATYDVQRVLASTGVSEGEKRRSAALATVSAIHAEMTRRNARPGRRRTRKRKQRM